MAELERQECVTRKALATVKQKIKQRRNFYRLDTIYGINQKSEGTHLSTETSNITSHHRGPKR